jgi:hypothetical protein
VGTASTLLLTALSEYGAHIGLPGGSAPSWPAISHAPKPVDLAVLAAAIALLVPRKPRSAQPA